MESDSFDLESVMHERRKAVEQSLRKISTQEMAAIGEELFAKNPSHPWKEAFDQFLQENRHGTFYHATATDDIQVIYCPDKDKGIWFMPGRGKGILGQRGRTVLKEIIARQ